jgi:hypothetical protein
MKLIATYNMCDYVKVITFYGVLSGWKLLFWFSTNIVVSFYIFKHNFSIY